MAELSLAHWHVWALVIATSLTAGTVRGFVGFGGPAIMILVLTQFYAPASVLSLVLLADYAANMQLIPGAMRHTAWRGTVPLIVASIVGLPLGIHLLQTVDPQWLKRGIALLVAACACAMLANWRYRREVRLAPAVLIGLTGGAIFGTTLIALPLMIFFFAGPAPAAEARANAITWGFFTTPAVILLFFLEDLLGVGDQWQAAFIACLYVLGAYAGARAFRRSSESRFRKFLLALLLVLSTIGMLT